MKKISKKIIKPIFVVLIVSSWLLTGWPGLHFIDFPPKPKEVKAISYVDVATGEQRNGTAATVTGWTATSGNLLVLFCSAQDNTTFNDITGWTPIRQDSTANGTMRSYFKASDGTETSVTCTAAASSDIYGIVLEYSGVDTSSASANNAANGSGDATAECASITPSGNNVYIAGVTFMDANTGAPALSWASDAFNERADLQLGAGPGTDRENYGAGDYFTFSGTHQTTVTHSGGGSYSWICHTISFNEAASTFTQNDWIIYYDNDAVQPADIWGNPDLAENQSLYAVPPSNDPVDNLDEVRIRMNITIGAATLSAGTEGFILQFKEASDCTDATAWTDMPAAAGGSIWEFADSTVTDNASMSATLLGQSNRAGRYSKSDPTSTNPADVLQGEDMEWDWHIEYVGTQQAATYCFRMRTDEPADLLYNSDSYPQVDIRPDTADLMRHGNFFTSGTERGLFWVD